MIESLKQVLDWGTDRIQAHCRGLKALLLTELGDHIHLPPEPTADHLYGISFSDGVDTDQLYREITLRNISVSLRGSYVRVSPHLYNTEEDIMALVDGVRSAT